MPAVVVRSAKRRIVSKPVACFDQPPGEVCVGSKTDLVPAKEQRTHDLGSEENVVSEKMRGVARQVRLVRQLRYRHLSGKWPRHVPGAAREKRHARV